MDALSLKNTKNLDTHYPCKYMDYYAYDELSTNSNVSATILNHRSLHKMKNI